MTMTTTTTSDDDIIPQSVEEAGALLGAAITRCSSNVSNYYSKTVAPPKGMHSSFATTTPVPMSELFSQLCNLKAQLKSVTSLPLVASPSLLAVLMKLLGVSSSMAMNNTIRGGPPMLSTPLRKMWVDCVVLCHVLGDGLSGKTRNDIFAFVRSMIALAGTNPKSAKAAGGTRIAAMNVLGGLFESPQLASKLAPWSLDVLQLCHRGLKSSGNGEPTHRTASVQTARAVVLACRQAHVKSNGSLQSTNNNNEFFVMRGALEDRAIVETVRLLRHASSDKFPEVRSAAAHLVGLVAPMLITQSSSHAGSSSGTKVNPSKPEPSVLPTASLEDVLVLSLRNVDDESAGVSAAWSEALGRCLCTSVAYGEIARATASERNASARNSSSEEAAAAAAASDSSIRFASRKAIGIAMTCCNLTAAIQFLVDHFCKVGGELAASRGGGSFSMGGRAVRVGVSLALVKLVSIQCKAGNIGPSGSMTLGEVIKCTLQMVGPEVQKQLRKPESGAVLENLDATSTAHVTQKTSSGSLFSSSRYKSHADAGLARVATSRVLRQGLSEMSSEPTQVNILHELIKMSSLGGGEASGRDDTGEGSSSSMEGMDTPLNSHQLQVALIEISHLVTTLGQAAASSLMDLVPALKECLSHSDHGVRHETTIACAAMAAQFPAEGQKLFRASVDDIQFHHAELVTLVCMGGDGGSQEVDRKQSKRRFRRSPGKSPQDKSLAHQYAIHGHALMISILLREFPRLPGGLSTDLLSTGLSVAEILVSCQYSDIMTKVNASAACTCVRAGYGIISGVLNTGATAITPHIALIFGLWQKSGKSAKEGSNNFTTDHDLICLDAALSTIVVFLKHCSELLMAVPDALSRTSLILEEALPLFLPGTGRLGSTPVNPAAASRLSSAKASIMEAFAWLPPGSFPLIADTLFAFAARHIQSGTEEEVTCSILPTLVNNEDKLLDAKTLCRAQRVGQVGGARDVEENLAVLTSEAAHHGERESVLHFFPHGESPRNEESFRGSQILGLSATETRRRPPTPLHEVGTWREPVSPSCCSKVRLIDAAVQAFAATFSMNDGKEQQRAMDMLESLVPPFLAQLARAIGVNTALTEPERRSKAKEESAAVANITAVLLACLQALPVYEATHNVPIGLGPRWMNKAKDLLLTLLPSNSNLIRRAAAQGLALLATLGVSEDAHTLQSAVLHSLDEVMQGNQPDGKPRPIPLEPVSAARAGSLLTLACIQRTAHNIKLKQNARKVGHPSPGGQDETLDDALPTIQMMTRVLPSINVLLRDAFVVKTYALHSFALLISYSARLDAASLSPEATHLLRKAIEAVEANFLGSWTVASTDLDQGQESEKLASEAAFLSVILRMMTFLLPVLHRFKDSDPSIAFRFSRMATSIMELCGSHPHVLVEGMAFFERLSSFQDLLPPPSSKVIHTENAPFTCGPILLQSIRPAGHEEMSLVKSPLATRAAVLCVELLCDAQVLYTDTLDAQIPPVLLALLEVSCGTHCYSGAALFRSIAAPREVERSRAAYDAIERQIVSSLDTCLVQESFATANSGSTRPLHWVLLARSLLTGSLEKAENDNDDDPYTRTNVVRIANLLASNDARRVLEHGSPSRWQVKCQAAKNGCMALQQIIMMSQTDGRTTCESPEFNPVVANETFIRKCREMKRDRPNDKAHVPSSFTVFHLPDILAAACSSSVATLDQSELHLLQEGGVRLLTLLVSATGDIPDPEQKNVSLLEQYATQIFSSLKHALGSEEENGGEGSFNLFMAGCEALQTVVEKGLVTDPMALKRLVRPVIPSSSEIPFYPYPVELAKSPFRLQEDDVVENETSSLLPRIGKLSTLATLKFFVDQGVLADNVSSPILESMAICKREIAAHSAAIAIDGVRLLRGHGMSLCGTSVDVETDPGEAGDEASPVSCKSGLTFAHIVNLDDSTKAAMVQAWPVCACNSVIFLVEMAEEEATDTADSIATDACATWLTKVVPVLFVGLHDALSNLTVNAMNKPEPSWARGLVPKDVAVVCLHGIRELVKGSSNSDADFPGKEDLAVVVDELSGSVLSPVLGVDQKESDQASETEEKDADQESSNSKDAVTENSRDLVHETCQFLEEVAGCSLSQDVDASILRAVLTPLDAIQKGSVALDNGLAAHIVTSCLKAAAKLLKSPKAEETFVKAMLHLSLELLSPSIPAPEDVTEAASMLLVQCMDHESTTASEQRLTAKSTAAEGNWDAWAVVCGRLEDGSGMRHSLYGVRNAMEDLQDHQRHVAVLTAVRRVVQGAPIGSQLVGCVMHGVGAQALMLLRCYGTLSHIPTKDVTERRTLACADAMKITMLGFQHLTSEPEPEEQQISAFLSVVFEVLVSLILFNGLPNHPSPTLSGADPALGRMSAQATMHVVRTTPALFKASMASMSEQGRAVLEMAVRAEMSGYAAPQTQAPEKKKLSLKGFKK